MKNSINYLPSILILTLFFLGGCAPVGPYFERLESQLPERWNLTASGQYRERAEEENTQWWKQFNDPVLDALVKTAYEQNLSLQTAGLRILEARARLGLAEGNLYPQTQEKNGDLLTIGTTGPASNRYYNSTSVGFDAAWEMDFWGKFRRSIESADFSLLADIASYDNVLVSLTAEVARTYITISYSFGPAFKWRLFNYGRLKNQVRI